MEIMFILIMGPLFIAEICFACGYFSWGENPKLEYYLSNIGTIFVAIGVMALILFSIFDINL